MTDQHVILQANDDYFLGRPNIDQVVFQRVAFDALPIYIRQQRSITRRSPRTTTQK